MTSLICAIASTAPLGVGLDRLDPPADVLGRLGGLLGQVLDLAGDHREALAGLAGPGRLDGGVQGQQVGLLGDRGDHLDHVADLGGGLAELATVSLVARRPSTALVADPGRLAGVLRDLPDRRAHLLGAGRHRLHVAPRPARRRPRRRRPGRWPPRRSPRSARRSRRASAPTTSTWALPRHRPDQFARPVQFLVEGPAPALQLPGAGGSSGRSDRCGPGTQRVGVADHDPAHLALQQVQHPAHGDRQQHRERDEERDGGAPSSGGLTSRWRVRSSSLGTPERRGDDGLSASYLLSNMIERATSSFCAGDRPRSAASSANSRDRRRHLLRRHAGRLQDQPLRAALGLHQGVGVGLRLVDQPKLVPAAPSRPAGHHVVAGLGLVDLAP